MSYKINELSPKQLRALRLIAEGCSATDAARQAGYCVEQVSRLHHSPQGEAFISKMLAQAETELATSLPELVQLSLKNLKWQLENGSADRKLKASALVIKLATPLLKNLTEAATDTGGVIIIEHCSPHQPKEGIYHEDDTQEP